MASEMTTNIEKQSMDLPQDIPKQKTEETPSGDADESSKVKVVFNRDTVEKLQQYKMPETVCCYPKCAKTIATKERKFVLGKPICSSCHKHWRAAKRDGDSAVHEHEKCYQCGLCIRKWVLDGCLSNTSEANAHFKRRRDESSTTEVEKVRRLDYGGLQWPAGFVHMHSAPPSLMMAAQQHGTLPEEKTVDGQSLHSSLTNGSGGGSDFDHEEHIQQQQSQVEHYSAMAHSDPNVANLPFFTKLPNGQVPIDDAQQLTVEYMKTHQRMLQQMIKDQVVQVQNAKTHENKLDNLITKFKSLSETVAQLNAQVQGLLGYLQAPPQHAPPSFPFAVPYGVNPMQSYVGPMMPGFVLPTSVFPPSSTDVDANK